MVKHSYQPAGKGESRNQGESHGRAVLTEDGVRMARKLYKEGVPVSDLAAAVGVSVPTLWKSLVGQTWNFVPGAVEQRAFRGRKKKK